MPRRLIVNADDFGYTPGVTQGILKAHREGIVTSTTVMINMPYAGEAIRLAQNNAPLLGLGLHLTLTAGRPILPSSQIPDLVQTNGSFRPKADFTAALDNLDLAQIEVECRAQIARFIEVAGAPPDHLDSHHHATYLSQEAAGVMFRLAKELDVPIRRAIPNESLTATQTMLQTDQQQTQDWVEGLTALFADTGVQAPNQFVVGFYGDQATLGDLLTILVTLPEGITELMCHPAEIDEALRASSSYIEKRADELAALIHPSTRELVQSEGIELITFGALR